jgi:hypothetical protein
MSRQISPSMNKVYGLHRVTRIWGVSRATVYRPPSSGGYAQETRTTWRDGG